MAHQPNDSYFSPRPNIFNEEPPPCFNPRGHEEVNPLTGEISRITHVRFDPQGNPRPLGCESYTCRGCAMYRARRVAFATELSGVTHDFGFTLVGDDYATINRVMADCSYLIRQRIPGYRCVWAAERNPEDTGNHVHGYCYDENSGPEQRLRRAMRDARESVGFGFKWHLKATSPEAGVAWFGYPMSSLADPLEYATFLDLNGGEGDRRIIHASRPFWRDGPDGPYLSRREAERRALRRQRRSKLIGPGGPCNLACVTKPG